MRIRLLDRYVAREFLRLFILFLTAMPLFICLMDLVERLDDYEGISAGRVALSYLYQMPTFMLWAFPAAALIATIFTVNNLARHSEVTAAKTGGISFHRLFLALPVLGVLLTGVALVLSEVAPVANRMRAEVLGKRPSNDLARANFVYRAQDGRSYTIQWMDAARGEVTNVYIEQPPAGPDSPAVFIQAAAAHYRENEGWWLQEGYVRFLYEGRDERTFEFGEMRAANWTERPEEIVAIPKDPDQMRYGELGRFIEIAQRSGTRPLKLMVEQAQKIAIPVATLIIILFAAPLAHSSPRGGAAYGIGISLGITIVYLMLFKIAGGAGAAGVIPPIIAAWIPNALFAAAGVILTLRVRT